MVEEIEEWDEDVKQNIYQKNKEDSNEIKEIELEEDVKEKKTKEKDTFTKLEENNISEKAPVLSQQKRAMDLYK